MKKIKNNVNEANMAVLQPEGVNDSSDINPEMYVDKKPSISENSFLLQKKRAECPASTTGLGAYFLQFRLL